MTVDQAPQYLIRQGNSIRLNLLDGKYNRENRMPIVLSLVTPHYFIECVQFELN